MNVVISQSNYIPWKGFFDGLAQSDVYVAYDDMQYTKRDWRNRNKIKTESGLKWLSIPVEVKGKYFQKIKDTKIADQGWVDSHLGVLKAQYKNAEHFNEMWSFIESIYKDCRFEYLTEVNLHFIRSINAFLGIDTEIKTSSEFELAEDRTQRLVNICTDLGADKYFSGPAAKAYMQENLFTEHGVELEYFDYQGYDEYEQVHPPFEHGVSILDMILNLGSNTKSFMKFPNQ